MSDQEQTKLMLERIAAKLDEHCEYTKAELSTIRRGVYGDPENKVPGLMDRQLEDEKRIGELESHNKKEDLQKKTILWVVGIVFTVIQAVGIAVWEFVKSLK